MADPRKQMVRWFGDDDPDYLCSFCGERLEEPDEGEGPIQLELDGPGPAIRVWKEVENPKRTLEARFHQVCFNQCLELGIFAFRDQPPGGKPAA